MLRPIAIGVAFISALSACTQIRSEIGENFRPALNGLLAEDTNPRVDEILASLGPPRRITALPEGYAFVYQSVAIDEKQLGLSSTLPVLRFFKLALARSDARITTAVFQFDAAGTLVARATEDSTVRVGDGGGISFVMSVMPVVDTANYERGVADGEDWGMALLEAVGQPDNRANDLDTGEGGFELLGSPVKVGQRTLEYR